MFIRTNLRHPTKAQRRASVCLSLRTGQTIGRGGSSARRDWGRRWLIQIGSFCESGKKRKSSNNSSHTTAEEQNTYDIPVQREEEIAFLRQDTRTHVPKTIVAGISVFNASREQGGMPSSLTRECKQYT